MSTEDVFFNDATAAQWCRPSARDIEQSLVERCAAVARDAQAGARDAREANVFRVAAGLIRSRFPAEAFGLAHAADHYFAQHPEDRLPAEAVVRRRWVIGLPRLRERLSFELERQSARESP